MLRYKYYMYIIFERWSKIFQIRILRKFSVITAFEKDGKAFGKKTVKFLYDFAYIINSFVLYVLRQL